MGKYIWDIEKKRCINMDYVKELRIEERVDWSKLKEVEYDIENQPYSKEGVPEPIKAKYRYYVVAAVIAEETEPYLYSGTHADIERFEDAKSAAGLILRIFGTL